MRCKRLQRHGAWLAARSARHGWCAATPGATADTTRCPRTPAACFTRLFFEDTPMTDMRRTLLWLVFVMSLVLLWDAWNKHTGAPPLFGGLGARRGQRPPPRRPPAPSAARHGAVPSATSTTGRHRRQPRPARCRLTAAAPAAS
jgi:hypothetical protein